MHKVVLCFIQRLQVPYFRIDLGMRYRKLVHPQAMAKCRIFRVLFLRIGHQKSYREEDEEQNARAEVKPQNFKASLTPRCFCAFVFLSVVLLGVWWIWNSWEALPELCWWRTTTIHEPKFLRWREGFKTSVDVDPPHCQRKNSRFATPTHTHTHHTPPIKNGKHPFLISCIRSFFFDSFAPYVMQTGRWFRSLFRIHRTNARGQWSTSKQTISRRSHTSFDTRAQTAANSRDKTLKINTPLRIH